MPQTATVGAWAARIIGLGAHLLLVFWYAASGLLAPGWAIAVLFVIWLALLALAIRWWRPRPYAVLAVPVIGVVIWFVALTLGERVLGWTG